jgi:hypothetical protein
MRETRHDTRYTHPQHRFHIENTRHGTHTLFKSIYIYINSLDTVQAGSLLRVILKNRERRESFLSLTFFRGELDFSWEGIDDPFINL